VGALLIIYAMRSGKAMIVSPAINGLYPVITIVLSLALHGRIPEPWNTAGMVLAVAAVLMMSTERHCQPRNYTSRESIEPCCGP
jgi:drug/metabolite transporter (DMT)-like permease